MNDLIHDGGNKTAVALPETMEDLASMYALKRDRSFNDVVEGYFKKLITDENFRRYINEIHRDEAVEGDLFLDDAEAARIIRTEALSAKDMQVANATLKSLIRALRVVMCRYNLGRNQRRDAAED